LLGNVAQANKSCEKKGSNWEKTKKQRLASKRKRGPFGEKETRGSKKTRGKNNGGQGKKKNRVKTCSLSISLKGFFNKNRLKKRHGEGDVKKKNIEKIGKP